VPVAHVGDLQQAHRQQLVLHQRRVPVLPHVLGPNVQQEGHDLRQLLGGGLGDVVLGQAADDVHEGELGAEQASVHTLRQVPGQPRLPAVQTDRRVLVNLNVHLDALGGRAEVLEGDVEGVQLQLRLLVAQPLDAVLALLPHVGVVQGVLVPEDLHDALHEDGGELFDARGAVRLELQPRPDPADGVLVVQQRVKVELDHGQVELGVLRLRREGVRHDVRLVDEVLLEVPHLLGCARGAGAL